MKVFAALLLASAGIALAKPSHLHRHMHPKRDEVEIVYQLGDQLISEAEALEGLKNGTFIYLNGGVVAASKTETAQPTTTAPAAVETPKEEPKPQAAAAAPQQQPDYGDDSTAGVDKDFPDGTIDCSHFPSEYGAVPLPWLNLDGWAGVQKPNVEDAGGYADIYTQKGDLCGDGECCSPGSFCSYACPDGYTKTQWPSKQGATGQSVGGLYCDGGKLTLPNGGLSNKLCMPGSEQVQLVVENRLDRSVSICSTDYPGTENMVIPVHVKPGATSKLLCPDSEKAYRWQGKKTSAQLYVNPAGVEPPEACIWSHEGTKVGNWAPLNMGLSFTDGLFWGSLFQNLPTQPHECLDYSIEFKGDCISGSCKYTGGRQYCSDTGCNDGAGCTISATPGCKVTVVIS